MKFNKKITLYFNEELLYAKQLIKLFVENKLIDFFLVEYLYNVYNIKNDYEKEINKQRRSNKTIVLSPIDYKFELYNLNNSIEETDEKIQIKIAEIDEQKIDELCNIFLNDNSFNKFIQLIVQDNDLQDIAIKNLEYFAKKVLQ